MEEKHKDNQSEDKNETIEEVVEVSEVLEESVEPEESEKPEEPEEPKEPEAPKKKQSVKKEKEGKKTGRIIGIALGLIALIALIVVAIIFIPKGDLNTVGANVDDVIDEPVSEEKETSVELGPGGVTTTINGREVSYNAAYVVNGIEATISAGEYVSSKANEAVFLVVNGGSLTYSYQ